MQLWLKHLNLKMLLGRFKKKLKKHRWTLEKNMKEVYGRKVKEFLKEKKSRLQDFQKQQIKKLLLNKLRRLLKESLENVKNL